MIFASCNWAARTTAACIIFLIYSCYGTVSFIEIGLYLLLFTLLTFTVLQSVLRGWVLVFYIFDEAVITLIIVRVRTLKRQRRYNSFGWRYLSVTVRTSIYVTFELLANYLVGSTCRRMELLRAVSSSEHMVRMLLREQLASLQAHVHILILLAVILRGQT